MDVFAARVAPAVRAAVRASSAATAAAREAAFARDVPDPAALRDLAARIRAHALDHLPELLERAEERLTAHGAHVHWAADAGAARDVVRRVFAERGVTHVAKSKSMATEEIGLAAHLAAHGITPVETDLGEFLVQIEGDRPSHVVKPVIHMDRARIARAFERRGLGPYDDRPEEITRRARMHLRGEFLRAGGAVSGANFLVAESGRIVIVTNEGNSRFGLGAARVHVAVVGIEKLVPRDRDLAVLLNVLARSATGQAFTSYVELVQGPRAPGRADGASELHVVLLDAGRSALLASEARDVLRCIRCGACMNVCPVYRAATGHAYPGTYPGPLGAVLAPHLAGASAAATASASSLCGACADVCPVAIPLPELIAAERARGVAEGTAPGPSLAAWEALATRPRAWRAALRAARLLNAVPDALAPHPLLRAWLGERTLPAWRGGAFRDWWRRRGDAR